MTTATRPLALVTGASSGIGRELADQFASHGHDLLVASEDAVGLSTAAHRLGGHGHQVTEVVGDLRTADGVEALAAAVTTAGRPLDALVLDAGIGQGGAFLDQELSDVLSIVDLNVRSTVHLARLLLPAMVQRGQGRVLVLSSIASTVPGSYQAVYNASKSFVQSWTEALQSELADTGVTLTSLMPGPVETDFFHRADMDDTPVGQQSKDDPADVAAEGYAALMAGKKKVFSESLSTKVMGTVAGLVPDGVKAALHKQISKPR